MFMQCQVDQDIEFLPSDDVVEPELAGAEDEAVHLRERDEPWDLMAVDAEDFDADQLEDESAEELDAEAADVAETDPPEEEVDEGHEEDVAEILRRHHGIVSPEPEEEPAWQPTGAAEFVCRSCFLCKPTSQLADPSKASASTADPGDADGSHDPPSSLICPTERRSSKRLLWDGCHVAHQATA